MAGTTTTFTLSLSDLGTIAGIVVVVTSVLAWFIRQSVAQIKSDMALELQKSENRIAEKVRLQFVEKEMMDEKLKTINEKIAEVSKENDHSTR